MLDEYSGLFSLATRGGNYTFNSSIQAKGRPKALYALDLGYEAPVAGKAGSQAHGRCSEAAVDLSW